MLIGLVHVALISPHYRVGSFDDDAGYIMAARSLVAGHGLTAHLSSGETVVGLYPPGYSALLAPLVWIWPHTFAPLRLLSVVCYAAIFPLTWAWLGRFRVPPALRAAVLLVLALGPPLATYGSMVMAETPFLVVLLLLLIAVDRWRLEPRVFSRPGLEVVLLAAGLVWLKQAAIGLVAGLILWWPLSRSARKWAKAGLLGAGVAVSLVPVVVDRLATGIPLAGARYSQELGGYYEGGFLKRLVDVVPGSAWHLVSTAIPATIVPYLEPLPLTGGWVTVWTVLSWAITLLVVLGAATWSRRHRDAAVPMAVVYLAESVLWPFVNERRAILVLPLLATWFVLGGAVAWQEVSTRIRAVPLRQATTAAGVTLAGVAVLAPLVAQLPRDYLYGWGQDSSRFGGSRYVAVLRALGRPSSVVETDYRSSTALFTGHQTNWDAFVYNQGHDCNLAGVESELSQDRAAYLLLGDVNKPGLIDNECLAGLAGAEPWAVPILHTSRDGATVFELVGPSTGNPGLVDRLSGTRAVVTLAPGQATLTWTLAVPGPLSQISVGEASAAAGVTDRVRLEVQQPGGGWAVVALSGSGVGDGRGQAPFLLANRSVGDATAVRVVVDGPGAGSGAVVDDVAAVGPPGPVPAGN
jgi:hypothetical protein